MAAKPAIYVANESFLLGGTTAVNAGDTVVAGHPLLKGREHLFRPFSPTFGDLPVDASPSFAERMAAAKAAKADGEAD